MRTSNSITKGAKALRLGAVAALAAVGATAALMALPAGAYAYSSSDGGNSIGTVGCPDGNYPRTYYVTSVQDAKQCIADMISTSGNKMQETKVTVTLSKDWNTKDTGRFEVPEGCQFTFNLNGHMINRGLAGTKGSDMWWGTGSGEAFIVRKNATLTVNGGSTSIAHSGTLSDNNRFWKYDANGSAPVYGGLITGAANDDIASGGAITMAGKNSKVYLNDVTLAGNVHDEFLIEHADGGGVYVAAENSMLELNNANVIYNHAEGYGGGICVWGNSCPVSIKNASRIDSNFATKNGGGISHHGKNGKVYIGGKSTVSSNEADKYGGGIYDVYNGTQFVLSNSSISNNKLTNEYSSGGGVFLEDIATLSLEKGSTISGNSAFLGGGIYLDDNDTAVTLTNRSYIESNTAQYEGGGVYMSDDQDTLVLDGQSSIRNNSAGSMGGGVFAQGPFSFNSHNQSITLKGGSTVSGNSAAVYGGGIASDSTSQRFKLTVSSPDATGSIVNNTSEKAGGLVGTTIVVLDNVSITGNTASVAAGGVSQGEGVLTGYIVLKGTVKITGNTAAGAASNLLLRESLGADSSVPLATNSRVGISVSSKVGDGRLVTEKGLCSYLGDDFEEALFSDDITKSVEKRDDGCLWLVDKPSKHTVAIYGADATPSYQRAAYESTVTLDSAKFAKEGCVLDYWTLEGSDDGDKILPDSSGMASFKMLDKNVTVRAHYASVLTTLQLTLRQDSTWSAIGDNPKREAYVESVRLSGINNLGYGFSADNQIREAIKVIDISPQTEQDGTKKVTYTVEMSKEALSSFGMVYVSGKLDAASAQVRANFASATDSALEVTADEGGNLTIKATVTFANPATAVIIQSVDQNKIVQGAFSTEVKQLTESDGTAGGSSTVTVTAPDQPGWTFDHWSGLPSNVKVDATSPTLILARADVADATLTAVYKPLASAVSIKMANLVCGEAFPSTVESVWVAGAKELDISKYVVDTAKVTWTKADGSPVGDTVEGDTTYIATITTAGSSELAAKFGFDSSVYTTVNGTEAASATYEPDSAKQTVTYVVRSASDTRYGGLLYERCTSNIYYGGDVSAQDSSDLPAKVYYKLKNGEIKSAPVTWDTSAVDPNQSSGTITVPGIFNDVYGDEHDVQASFKIVALGAPEPTYEDAGDDAGAQLVTLGKGSGWSDDMERAVYYKVCKYDDYSAADVDYSSFTPYAEGSKIELHADEVVLAYAKLKVGDDFTRQTELGVYGRSLELADISVSNAACIDGEAVPTVKVTLDGQTLTAGKDYTIKYNHNSKVGMAYVTVQSGGVLYHGSKVVSFKSVPSKISGVTAKKAGKGKAKVSWSKHKAQTSGFQVRYAASKAKLAAGKGKTIKVKGAAKKSVTVKNLKSGKKCFFKVRAYKVVDGKTYYSAWSKAVSTKVR